MTAPAAERNPRRHNPSCTGSDSDLQRWQGKREPMATCKACGRCTPEPAPAPPSTTPRPTVAAPAPAAPAETAASRRAAAVLGKWRCYHHPQRVVDRRGRGCSDCVRPVRRRRHDDDLEVTW